MDGAPRFFDILETLCRHRVELIVVGGVAAVLEGAPVSTFDLDVMHRRSPENLQRLLAALDELEALYKDPAGRQITPDLEKLESFRLHLLLTRFGPLDLLTEIAPGDGYDQLIEQTIVHEIAGMEVRVLELAAIIRSKEHAARDKDRATLPVLRRTLELRRSEDST